MTETKSVCKVHFKSGKFLSAEFTPQERAKLYELLLDGMSNHKVIELDLVSSITHRTQSYLVRCSDIEFVEEV
jgi:hypothetical protein